MSYLGIDLGTTSVKITLYDHKRQSVIATSSQVTNAYVDSEFREQDVNLIWQALQILLTTLEADKLRNVSRIGVSGQMHGVVLWRKNNTNEPSLECSNLITWEDQRCSSSFLESLPPSKFQNICTGFGCASILWLARHRREILAHWNHAGTIADLLVTRLCGIEDCLMSPQNAASWGYFDVAGGKWEEEILSHAGFPLHLLPKVVSPGYKVGHVTSASTPLPVGAAVFTALGDLQASVLAALHDCEEGVAVVNVGTSAQLALPLADPCPLPSGVSIFPFFDANSRQLAVAASLNGGNVLAHFVATLRDWCRELGLAIEAGQESVDDPLWDRLASAAEEAEEEVLEVRPTLFGERHFGPEQACAAVLGVRPGAGLKMGAIYRAVCTGIMRNLREMTGEELMSRRVLRVIGTGSALRKNSVLRAAFLKTFADCSPRVLEEEVDASLGAALSVSDSPSDP